MQLLLGVLAGKLLQPLPPPPPPPSSAAASHAAPSTYRTFHFSHHTHFITYRSNLETLSMSASAAAAAPSGGGDDDARVPLLSGAEYEV